MIPCKDISETDYAARIPPCCSYRTLESHINGLGLCWSLVHAVEENRPMDCSRCELAIPGVRTLSWAKDATPVEDSRTTEGEKRGQ